MEVTLVDASWDVVAGDQTGVDFIPMKFIRIRSLANATENITLLRTLAGPAFLLGIPPKLHYRHL